MVLLHIIDELQDANCIEDLDVQVVADLLTISQRLSRNCPSLQMHVISAILRHRDAIIEDETFLAQTAMKSPSSLAALMSAYREPHPQYWYERKKEKSTQMKLKRLWHGSLDQKALEHPIPWSMGMANEKMKTPDVVD